MPGDTQFVIGSRPVHKHLGDVSGEWFCNSPYCNDIDVNKPGDGGPDVIHSPYSPSNPPPVK